MPLFLDKVLTQLAMPLGSALLGLLLAGLLLLLRRRALSAGMLTLSLAWLVFWSLPVVADSVRWTLERQHPPRAAGDMPVVDAIVVLGGSMNPGPGNWLYPDLNQSADRVWHAARLYTAGRAPQVIVSGGNIPWSGQGRTEAEAMIDLLTDLGVPAAAILSEGGSANTRGNALLTAGLLAGRDSARVLLVTSALHMPRALAVFRRSGVDAVAAATDHEVMPAPRTLLDWLPGAGALSDSSRALKEWLGLWVYRWRDWA